MKAMNSPMRSTLVSLRMIAAVGGLVFAAALSLSAQGQSMEGKTAEQAYKNIKVLKGTPADQLNLGMHLVEGELGVDCTYCHIDHDPTHFPLDDNPKKETARKMMQMVIDINKNTFEGKQVVTCYTCHQGHPKPTNTVVLPLPPATDAFIHLEEEKPMETPLPSVDQILAKYVQALGGEQALRKVTTRAITETQDLPAGPGGKTPLPAQIERYQKAPNLYVNIDHIATGTLADGYDGKAVWTQNPRGAVTDLGPALDQTRARRTADLYEPLNLKKTYAKMEVAGLAQVNGHEAYHVTGTPANDNPEELYFDVVTGLLLRKITVITTMLGDSPFQVDYDEYRETSSGVRYPFVMRMTPGSSRSEPQTHSTIMVQKVQDNVAIDDAKFVRPQSAPPPPKQ